MLSCSRFRYPKQVSNASHARAALSARDERADSFGQLEDVAGLADVLLRAFDHRLMSFGGLRRGREDDDRGERVEEA